MKKENTKKNNGIYRIDPEAGFVNPYNFVHYDKEKVASRRTDPSIKNGEGCHYGYLQCRLITRTPFAIPDTALREETEKGSEHFKYPFMSIENKDDVSTTKKK